MKLLVITSNVKKASFRQRIMIYESLLKTRNIECDFVKMPSGFWNRMGFFKKTASFDAVFLQKKRLNPFDVLLRKLYCKKLIYDYDDAVMYDDSNFAVSSWFRRLAFWLTIKSADIVIAGNDYLAAQARRYTSNVHILPTGLDIKSYTLIPPKQVHDKIRLVWIGSKGTLQYLRDISDVFETIGSRFPNVVLRIICDNFFDLNNMKVEKKVWSEPTQYHDLSCCDIGLAPLPDNRFTRGKCGFKVLQYAAAALPTIGSPVGINSAYINDGITGFLAQTHEQWVEKLSILINDQNLTRQMGANAKENSRAFDLAVIGSRLADIINSINGGSCPR